MRKTTSSHSSWAELPPMRATCGPSRTQLHSLTVDRPARTLRTGSRRSSSRRSVLARSRSPRARVRSGITGYTPTTASRSLPCPPPNRRQRHRPPRPMLPPSLLQRPSRSLRSRRQPMPRQPLRRRAPPPSVPTAHGRTARPGRGPAPSTGESIGGPATSARQVQVPTRCSEDSTVERLGEPTTRDRPGHAILELV